MICFKPATSWGGHVHKDGDTIIAGTCKEHYLKLGTPGPFSAQAIKNCRGCYGPYKAEMETDESFGQLGYIDKEGFHAIDPKIKKYE